MSTKPLVQLPVVKTPLSREETLARLSTASKRGRLPGFRTEHDLCTVAAHGQPFDGALHVRHSDGGLEFRLEMRRLMPALFASVLILTVWPGVYFMDELIAVFLPSLWRPWVTYYWYLPLTVLPLPWIWRGLMRRSRLTMQRSALEAIQKIAAEVDGTVQGATDAVQPTPR